MGNNYYTEVSDVLTDAFDILLDRAKKQHAQNTILEMISELRANTDATFRQNYKQAKTLLGDE